jgi:hypothetical protein
MSEQTVVERVKSLSRHIQREGVHGWLRPGHLRGIGGLFLARGM